MTVPFVIRLSASAKRTKTIIVSEIHCKYHKCSVVTPNRRYDFHNFWSTIAIHATRLGPFYSDHSPRPSSKLNESPSSYPSKAANSHTKHPSHSRVQTRSMHVSRLIRDRNTDDPRIPARETVAGTLRANVAATGRRRENLKRSISRRIPESASGTRARSDALSRFSVLAR